MGREILFRGKENITKKWHRGSLVISGENYYILEKWIKYKGHRQIMVAPATVEIKINNKWVDLEKFNKIKEVIYNG